MKKIFSLILLVLVTVLSFGDSIQIATLPMLGGKTAAVVVNGSGFVYVRLSEKSMTLSPSDAMEVSAYLDRFLEVDASNPKANVTLTELLGARAFVPLTPVQGKLFMVASITKGQGNAMGFRLVDFANAGGWGQDDTYYMDPDAVRLLRQALRDAVQKDQDLRMETTQIRSKILAYIN